MTSPNKHLLTAGLSFALLITVAAKPKPTKPTHPGEITQEGLQLNGPALNDQTLDTQTYLRELSPETVQVERPGST
ncbi:MAG: hypothetical protein ABG776_07155, partial [Cyanobacteria bacterium J06555_13]